MPVDRMMVMILVGTILIVLVMDGLTQLSFVAVVGVRSIVVAAVDVVNVAGVQSVLLFAPVDGVMNVGLFAPVARVQSVRLIAPVARVQSVRLLVPVAIVKSAVVKKNVITNLVHVVPVVILIYLILLL